MKHLLFAALLAAATPAAAQTVPMKNAETVIIHTADSARVAYRQMMQGLLANGYGIDRRDNEALFISTPAKSADGVVYLKIQAVTAPESSGAATTFRAIFTVTNAATLAAHIEGREMPVRYTGPGTNPMKRAWAELARVATASLPAGKIEYR